MTAISLAKTAKIVGLSTDRFRRVWRKWHDRVDFPAPFRGGVGRAGYAWDAEDVEAWKASRKATVGFHRPPREDRGAPRPTPSATNYGADPRQVAQARADLRRLRGEV